MVLDIVLNSAQFVRKIRSMNRKKLSVIFAQIFTVIIMLGLSGCVNPYQAQVSPYQGQADALNAAYQAGQISANDYHARMAEIQRLDFENRQAAFNGMQQILGQQAQQLQQQQQFQQQQQSPNDKWQQILKQQQLYNQQQELKRQENSPKTYRVKDQYGNEKTYTVEPQQGGF